MQTLIPTVEADFILKYMKELGHEDYQISEIREALKPLQSLWSELRDIELTLAYEVLEMEEEFE